MSEKIEEKAKTALEKLETVIEGYEKALQKITVIAEEDEKKIAEANTLAREVTVEIKQHLRTKLTKQQQQWIEATIVKLERLREVLK